MGKTLNKLCKSLISKENPTNFRYLYLPYALKKIRNDVIDMI